MQSSYAFHLPGSDVEVLAQLRDAALAILRKFGWEGPSMRPYSETAYAAGLFVAYFGAEPGTISRRDMTTWHSPIDEVEDDLQHVVEIRISEQVACFGWRGDGPIEIDLLRRGPWEFELLKAAGMSVPLPEKTLGPAPLAPEPLSLWVLKEEVDPLICSRQLETPLALTVVRHGLRASAFVPRHSSFADLRTIVSKCYAATCENDERPFAEGDPASCFCLEALDESTSSDPGYRGPPPQPELRYFIGSDDGISVAARLLLAFDYDDDSRRFDMRARSSRVFAGGEGQPATAYH